MTLLSVFHTLQVFHIIHAVDNARTQVISLTTLWTWLFALLLPIFVVSFFTKMAAILEIVYRHVMLFLNLILTLFILHLIILNIVAS